MNITIRQKAQYTITPDDPAEVKRVCALSTSINTLYHTPPELLQNYKIYKE